LKEQTGKDIYFDLVDHEKVRSFRIQKQLPFSTFKVTCPSNSMQVVIGANFQGTIFFMAHSHMRMLTHNITAINCSIGGSCEGIWHPSTVSAILVVG
jgi:hypothetical protein